MLSTAAFPNTANCITKEMGISCSSSLADAPIRHVHHPDDNICDLKKPIKPIWRWIACLRDIFRQARCLKTVVLHDTYWQAGHITVHIMWATESRFIFTGDLFLHLLKLYDWEGRNWHFGTMWICDSNWHICVCIYLYVFHLMFYIPLLHA